TRSPVAQAHSRTGIPMSDRGLRAGLLPALAFGTAIAAGLCSSLRFDLPAAGPADQVEPWADSRLPVSKDLTLWLDASRLAAARKAHDRAAPVDGEPVDV